MEPLITCTNVCKRIRQFRLDGIEFSLEPGYILGVIGQNGAGKSTLVQLILGGYYLDKIDTRHQVKKDVEGVIQQKELELRSPLLGDKWITPAEGDILIDGYSMRYHANEGKQRLAYVLSDCPFSMQLSGLENAKLYGTCYEGWQQEVFLKKSKEFGLDLGLPLRKLSKGQHILYQLSFALACDARLYIMDEPTANLDVSYRQLILDTMQELVETGEKSVIYVTHLLEDLEQVGDYILWIEQGRQVFFGEKEELLNSFCILTGTQKQFQYVEQMKPDAFLTAEYRPHASEGLVRGTGDNLPLVLDKRKPTLEELMFFYQDYYKKNKANLFLAGTEEEEIEETRDKPKKQYRFESDKTWESTGSEEKRGHFESPFD